MMVSDREEKGGGWEKKRGDKEECGIGGEEKGLEMMSVAHLRLDALEDDMAISDFRPEIEQ